MRRAFTSGLVACLPMLPTVTVAMAQDEDLRMGDDPAYFERVEVPEAGIAVSLPPDWDVNIEMAYDEMDPGDPATGYWNVLFASAEGGAWCEVTWYLAAEGLLPGLAALTADNFAEELGGDATAQATPVELAIGEAYRVDVQDPAEPSYTSIYMVDGEAGRYNMNCMAHARDARDWMDIAETLEWLPDEGDTEPVVEPDPDVDPEPVLLIKGYDLEFVTLDEGISGMLLPSDWDIEVEMEEHEYLLSPDYQAEGPAFYTSVLYAESELGDWCSVTTHQDNPMSLEEQAAWDEASFIAANPDDLIIEGVSEVMLGNHAGFQLDLSALVGLNAYRSHLYESGSSRFQVECSSVLGPNSA